MSANLSDIFDIGGKRIWDLELIPDGEGGWTERPRSISYPEGTKALFLTSSFDDRARMLITRNSAGEFTVICGDSTKWDDTNLFLRKGVVFLVEENFEIEDGYWREIDDDRTFRILADKGINAFSADERISVSADSEEGYAVVEFGPTFCKVDVDYGKPIRRYQIVDYENPAWFAIFSMGTALTADGTLVDETCFIFPFRDLYAAKDALCGT